MGPEASADFYLRIIRLFQQKFGCRDDSDYPEIFIYNLPLPDVVDMVESKDVILRFLQKGFDKLVQAGSDFIVSPCNTANTYFTSLEKDVQVVNILDETVKEAKDKGCKKTGILGTRQTIRSGGYQRRLEDSGISFSIPTSEEQDIVTQVLLNILAGKKQDADKIRLLEIISRFRKGGCDSVILGCTELPLLLKQDDSDIMLLDTLEILARATVRYSAGDDYED